MRLPASWYGNLATLVVAAHFTFILFVALGGLLAVRWRRAPWIHVPCFLWGAYIEWTGGVCPLTPLENALRRLAGEASYAGSFIEHYILAIVYPPGLTRSVQLILAAGVVVLNVAVYTWVLRRRGKS